MPVTRVERCHGEPAIMIDGRPYPPMTITVPIKNPAYLKDLGEAGLKIYYIEASTTWNNPGMKAPNVPFERGDHKCALNGLEQTIRDLDMLMSAVPDAYVMLRLNVAPPTDWVNAHPEEMLTYSDGSHRKVICTSVGRGEVLDGMHSLCSELWRRDADQALAEYFDALEKTPHFDRVIGFFLCAGGTSEWYYPQPLETEDGAYGDFSEPFRREFEQFLRNKYGTEEELRRVWKRPEATFAHPLIPTIEERSYVSAADEKIVKALREWETMGRTIGLELDMNAREETNVGVFLNANGYAHVADFYTAWHRATANTIIHFGHTLKKRFPDLLVGAFYGSYGCTSYFDGSTCSGTPGTRSCSSSGRCRHWPRPRSTPRCAPWTSPRRPLRPWSAALGWLCWRARRCWPQPRSSSRRSAANGCTSISSPRPARRCSCWSSPGSVTRWTSSGSWRSPTASPACAPGGTSTKH